MCVREDCLLLESGWDAWPLVTAASASGVSASAPGPGMDIQPSTPRTGAVCVPKPADRVQCLGCACAFTGKPDAAAPACRGPMWWVRGAGCGHGCWADRPYASACWWEGIKSTKWNKNKCWSWLNLSHSTELRKAVISSILWIL